MEELYTACMSRVEESLRAGGFTDQQIAIVKKAILTSTGFDVERTYDPRIEAIATANGYIKAEDYEALKLKLAEVTDQLEDATSTLDQIEAESACFDGLARSAGYVKLEPGQVVVNESKHSLALRMAAKWAEHVAGRDRGVTFTRISNLEARDE